MVGGLYWYIMMLVSGAAHIYTPAWGGWQQEDEHNGSMKDAVGIAVVGFHGVLLNRINHILYYTSPYAFIYIFKFSCIYKSA